MSYSCDDGEPCEWYRDKLVRARAEHQCTACSRLILPGHTYSLTTLKCDGEIHRHKRCGACELIYRHLVKIGAGDMRPMENLDCGLDYEEEWGDEPPDEVAALAFMTDEEAGRALAKADAPKGTSDE